MGCSASKFEIESTNTMKDKQKTTQMITDGDKEFQPKVYNGIQKTSKNFEMSVEVFIIFI